MNNRDGEATERNELIEILSKLYQHTPEYIAGMIMAGWRRSAVNLAQLDRAMDALQPYGVTRSDALDAASDVARALGLTLDGDT
jgi:hypothetical protein